jgi:hypothetical protein
VTPFPFVSEFIEQKSGTLYVLCDSAVRLRDAISAVALVRFFTARGVHFDVRPVLAGHRRFLSARDILRALGDPARRSERESARLNEALDTFVEELFNTAEAYERLTGRPERDVAGAAGATGPLERRCSSSCLRGFPYRRLISSYNYAAATMPPC